MVGDARLVADIGGRREPRTISNVNRSAGIKSHSRGKAVILLRGAVREPADRVRC